MLLQLFSQICLSKICLIIYKFGVDIMYKLSVNTSKLAKPKAKS